jgi:predicted transcriptional regulator
MTDGEEILVSRVGCIAVALIALIRKYPEKNSRTWLASRINMNVKTVRVVATNLIELGVITEETVDRNGLEWHKRFVVNPETEWKLQ